MNGRWSTIRATGAICLVLITLAAIPQLQAQSRITGEGTQGFRALLAGKGLTPIESVKDLESLAAEDPSRVLIISFHGARPSGEPYEDAIDNIEFDLRNFVDRGGALFVATDQKLSAQLTARFSVAVTGDFVSARGGPGFDSSYDCPYLARANGAEPDLFRGPDGELRFVATNRPSCLPTSGAALPILAEFPAGKWHCDEFRMRERLGRPLPFALGQSYAGGGRFLLLADHSIFINSMMLPRGRLSNDNLQFAFNCVDWLMFGEKGQRTHVIFMEDGRIWQRKDYDLSLQALPVSPEELADYLWQNKDLIWKHPEVADAVASELEQSGIFQEIERADPFNAFLSQYIPQIVRALLIVGAVILACYALGSFIRSRHPVSRKMPRLAMVLNQLRPRVGLLDQRVRNGLGQGLFEELARRQAREMFAKLDLTPAEGVPAPRFTVEAPFWRRNQIIRDLRRAWVVAFGPDPIVMSVYDRQRWQGRLSLLKAMIRDQAIRIG